MFSFSFKNSNKFTCKHLKFYFFLFYLLFSFNNYSTNAYSLQEQISVFSYLFSSFIFLNIRSRISPSFFFYRVFSFRYRVYFSFTVFLNFIIRSIFCLLFFSFCFFVYFLLQKISHNSFLKLSNCTFQIF